MNPVCSKALPWLILINDTVEAANDLFLSFEIPLGLPGFGMIMHSRWCSASADKLEVNLRRLRLSCVKEEAEEESLSPE